MGIAQNRAKLGNEDNWYLKSINVDYFTQDYKNKQNSAYNSG